MKISGSVVKGNLKSLWLCMEVKLPVLGKIRSDCFEDEGE